VSIKVNIKVNMLQLRFEKSENGLLPAIAQDYQTGEILMLAYINPESWQKTIVAKNTGDGKGALLEPFPQYIMAER